MTPDKKLWLKPSEAAQELGLTPRIVRERCADGLLKCRPEVGPSGAIRYYIHRDAIAGYNNRGVGA